MKKIKKSKDKKEEIVGPRPNDRDKVRKGKKKIK